MVHNGVSSAVIVLSLLLWAILAGVWRLFGTLHTFVAELLFPPALGLPTIIPPLRLSPLGETSIVMWLSDLTGVLVMLIAGLLWVGSAVKKQPHASRRRIFGRGVRITLVAVLCGNVVRYLFHSAVILAGPWTFVGQLLATVLVSIIVGAVLGVVTGLVAAALHTPPEGVLAPGRTRPANQTARA